MKLGGDLSVYYYDISISPEVIADSYIIQGISRNIRKQLNMIMGIYVISGKNIFTPTLLEESILIKAEYKSQEYDVTIDSSTRHFLKAIGTDGVKMEDHCLVQNFINIIIKQAFRDTNLR